LMPGGVLTTPGVTVALWRCPVESAYQEPPASVQSKQCTKCGERKPLEEFSRSKQSKDGYAWACRACRRAANLADYYRNRERRQEVSREWKAANLDQVTQRKRKWEAANVERRAQSRREYAIRNIEREREYARQWRAAHPERVLERERQRDKTKKRANGKRYYARHRDVLKVKQRAYFQQRYSENPEAYTDQLARRRARKMGASICDFTAHQWELVKLLYGFRCAYCGCSPAVLHREHVRPLAKGGDHTLSNIVPACVSCNARKHLSIWLPVLRTPG